MDGDPHGGVRRIERLSWPCWVTKAPGTEGRSWLCLLRRGATGRGSGRTRNNKCISEQPRQRRVRRSGHEGNHNDDLSEVVVLQAIRSRRIQRKNKEMFVDTSKVKAPSPHNTEAEKIKARVHRQEDQGHKLKPKR